ncbi:MAG: DUF2155 domain-containing protein [Alphaproteobacteria bacterium]|nr:DUF2155 domain-containing protein [Alphaproteobacteria bacterium]
MESMPVVKLQSLDKVTARTLTFEARVGSTIKFGPLYIKVQSCQKASPIEPPEAAAFLQIWQAAPKESAAEQKSEWVFSGWMFASSPALSSMDHPIYDVWVLDCLPRKSDEPVPEDVREGEGELPAAEVPAEPKMNGGAAAPASPAAPGVLTAPETEIRPAPVPENAPVIPSEPTSADDGDIQE